ncbi:MAG TPA: Hsp20/alpha crystallin family protein [Gemmatimonadaceae bacterium]|nr:Hsp20/alpha crystallin family protein [Gemmatimonadaceae bacterium]
MAYRGGVTPFVGGLGSLFGLRREIDRVFEDAYGGSGTRAGWTPSANVREGKDSVLLEMELPGISPDEVDISIENDMLTVRGEKREERQEGEEEGRYFLLERSYGSFSRSFSLPLGVDADKVGAEFDNGLLTIRIPRAALPQPRRIQIGGKQGDVSSGRESGRPSPARTGGRIRNGGERQEERVAAGAREEG